jgi:hypothetical protein
MNPFEEILWPQFVQLDRVRKLPLNEQIKEYNQYIYDLSIARLNWLNDQPKGSLTTPTQQEFLLQENGFLLQQENGFNIILE